MYLGNENVIGELLNIAFPQFCMFVSDACGFSPLFSLPESIIVTFTFLLHSASVATSVQISQTNALPPDHQG